MALTSVAPYRPPDMGGNMLNFLMGLMSLEERKALRKEQSRRTDIAEEQLGISKGELTERVAGRRQYGKLMGRQLDISKGELTIEEAGEARTATAFKETAGERGARTRLVERHSLADRKVAEAQRAYDVAKQSGDVDKQASTARDLSTIKSLYGRSAEMLETIVFADEMAKDSRAQLAIAQQEIFGRKQAMELIQMQHASEMQAQSSMYGAVASTLNVDNLPAGIAAIEAIRNKDMDTFGKMHASMRATAARRRMEPEERKFVPSNLYTNVIEQFGDGTYQQLLVAEAANLPYPDVRSVYKDVQWPGSNWQKILTREEAKAKGVEDRWLEGASIDLEKMGERVQPQPSKPQTSPKTKAAQQGAGRWGSMPAKKKTVKELADEKAKKVKPAGTKAAKKPASKETRGGYTVGQIIEAGGKRYKVTSFDTDGEPLVTEVK